MHETELNNLQCIEYKKPTQPPLPSTKEGCDRARVNRRPEQQPSRPAHFKSAKKTRAQRTEGAAERGTRRLRDREREERAEKAEEAEREHEAKEERDREEARKRGSSGASEREYLRVTLAPTSVRRFRRLPPVRARVGPAGRADPPWPSSQR
eukprot:5245-Rhodomonas_salina.2